MIYVVVAAVVAAGCGAGPSCAIAPHPDAAAPFLWKARRGDGPIVWFYGTIHNAGADDVPEAAWRALESSRRLISELGDVEVDREATAALARLPPGKGIDQLLPASDWCDLRDAVRGAIKEDDLKRFRPWYAMARLTAQVARSASPAMDVALAKRARSRGIAVDPLESLAAQLAALADTVTISDLQQAIHERKTIRCELETLRATYNRGDLPAMMRLLVIAQTQRLLVERSNAWLKKIEPSFVAGGAFVAVGLGHLLGPDGIPEMLERSGYKVERIAR